MIAGGGQRRQLQVTQEPFSAVIVVDISDQLKTMDILDSYLILGID